MGYSKVYLSMFSFHVVQGACKKYFKIKIFLRNRISKNCSWKIAILELIQKNEKCIHFIIKVSFRLLQISIENEFCISLLLCYLKVEWLKVSE